MHMVKRAGLTAFCALAAVPAAAQLRDTVPERHVDFGVSIDELYDTNVSRTADQGASLRGLRQEDFRITPAATVDALVLLGRQTLSATGSLGYDFYNRNTRLNRERIGLNGALGLNVAGCSGSVTAGYARRQSDLGDLLILTGDTRDIARFRNTEEIKTVGASAICGGAIGLRPTASINQTWADNSTDFRQFSDYRSTVVSGGLAYSQPTLGTVTVFASAGQTTFPNRRFVAGGDEDGFDQASIGGRFERRIGARLRGSAELSYTKVSPDRAGVRGFGGLTWNGSLIAQVGDRLQVTGLVSRAVQASNRVDANYFIEKNYALNATYALSPRLNLVGGVLQTDRDFNGSTGVFGPVLLEDRVRSVNAGARLRWSRLVTLALTGVHEEREANGSFYDYTSDRVLFSAALKI